MIKRWLLFLTLWGGCLFLYGISRAWSGLVLLEVISLLPLISLLVSLPAAKSARLTVDVPDEVHMGSKVPLKIQLHCSYPAPRRSAKIIGRHNMTGEESQLVFGGNLPTEHCGTLECRIEKTYIYDYLGLFRFRLRSMKNFIVTIIPTPVEMPGLTSDENQPVVAWRPKPGGGFAENHELRPYRPGDNLKQIHWKMSAKVDGMIYRESMVPDTGGILLWTVLNEGPDAIDRKLGKLLWMSRDLDERGLKHDILVYTAKGAKRWSIGQKFGPEQMITAVLRHSPAEGEIKSLPGDAALWKFFIGGDENEKV